MANVGTLSVKLVADLKKFVAGMKVAAERTKTFANTVGTAMRRAARSVKDFAVNAARNLKNFVTRWARRAIIALGAMGAAAIKWAADAEESENLVRESFEGMTDQVVEWSETLQRQLGLNAVELRRQAGFLQLMINSYGLTAEKATEMATTLVELSADMASFRNQKFEVMFEKIRSGIAGMSRPLKELGINLQEDAVDMLLLRNGIKATSADLTQQQKVLARYALLLEATTKDQGDLARTYDTTTNAVRVLLSQVKILGREMGEVLLPHVNSVAVAMRDWLIENRQDIVAWFNNAVDVFMRFVDFLRADFKQGFAGSLEGLALIANAVGDAIVLIFKQKFETIGVDALKWLFSGWKRGLARNKRLLQGLGKSIRESVFGVGEGAPDAITGAFKDLPAATEKLTDVQLIFAKLKTDLASINTETIEWAKNIKLSDDAVAEAASKRAQAFDELQAKLEQSRKENAAKAQEAIAQLKQTVEAQKQAAEVIEESWANTGETIKQVIRAANDEVKFAFVDMLETMAVEMNNFEDAVKAFFVAIAKEIARMQARLVAARIFGTQETGGAGGGGFIADIIKFLAGSLGGTKTQAKARGGIIKPVFAAKGFAPRGSDTVPAMLTPGEGVLSKDLTQALREQLAVPGGMSGPAPVMIQVQTIDTQSTAQWLNTNKRLIAGMLNETRQGNNPSSRRFTGQRR
jgi:hypothetical protein